MPRDVRPSRLVGCEVWRDLDWLADADKIPLLLDGHENLETALLGVFDSQIAGGKRYDLAVMGRKRANATFLESHNVEAASALTFGIDLTPLLSNDQIDVISFIQEHIHRSAADVAARLARLG